MKATFLNLFLAMFMRRESMANDIAFGEVRETAIANALDPSDAIDFSESADGWFKIAPYGTFRGSKPGRQQLFTIDSAKAMESEFNSLLGKLGRKFRGVPIYHGHPDVDAEVWPDDRRLGKVTKVESRSDGFWGFAEWNSIGLENKAEGYWIYPSPRWDAPPGQKQFFEPDRLLSVGLTNTPRIAPAEGNEPVFNSLPKPSNTIMDRTALTASLGLPPEATDEEILAKITALQSAATEAETKVATANTDKATADATAATEKKAKEELANSVTAKDTEIINLREAHNNSLLDAAERDTRITAAERADWAAKLNGTDRETQMNSLKALKPKLNGKALELANRRDERAQGDDLREQVANSISKMKKDDGLTHDQAWKKAKKNPAFKAYFERIEG